MSGYSRCKVIDGLMLQAGGKVIAEKEWSKTVSTKGDASLGLVECECFFVEMGIRWKDRCYAYWGMSR